MTNLAASNIAWDPADDDVVARILTERGFTGVEIAPSKRWKSPLDATQQEIVDYREAWSARGLPVVALQALLFGRPDLALFGSAPVRNELRNYLFGIIELGHKLGVQALVFGSPKNRKRNGMPLDEATDIAVDFFRDVGAVAASLRCVVCIEPNPAAYDCDFINTTAEAVALCERIGSPAVKVNGDAGAIAMNGEDPRTTIAAAAEWFGHFHASEPSLAEISEGRVHEESGATLRACNYANWVSIEMRAGASDSLRALSRAAEIVRRQYGDGLGER